MGEIRPKVLWSDPKAPGLAGGDRDKTHEAGGGRLTTSVTIGNSKARGVGMCDNGDKGEVGGDGESTAIMGAACKGNDSGIMVRVLGLSVRTPLGGGGGAGREQALTPTPVNVVALKS